MQSPPITTRIKRRFSNDEEETKKVKQQSECVTPQKQEYPVFHHPDGGLIRFTPDGIMRTIIDENNREITTVEPTSKFDISNTSQGIDGYALHISGANPGSDAESYMAKGYTGAGYSYYSSEDNTASRLNFFFNDDDEFESDEEMDG